MNYFIGVIGCGKVSRSLLRLIGYKSDKMDELSKEDLNQLLTDSPEIEEVWKFITDNCKKYGAEPSDPFSQQKVQTEMNDISYHFSSKNGIDKKVNINVISCEESDVIIHDNSGNSGSSGGGGNGGNEIINKESTITTTLELLSVDNKIKRCTFQFKLYVYERILSHSSVRFGLAQISGS